jgi:hypothetical protein
MVTRRRELVAFHIDERGGHDVRVARYQRLHGATDRVNLTSLCQLRELNGECLADLLTLIQKRASFVARESENHVSDQDHT